MKPLTIGLLAGLLIGALGAVFLPRVVGPYLPATWRGTTETVDGTVAAKRLEPDRLLLTIHTHEGSTLATFKKRIEEIDLLVEQGDRVGLALDGYEPFVEDPPIRRVSKPETPPPPVLSPAEPLPQPGPPAEPGE